MKIAVTSQNYRTVTPHAGRTRRFLIYEGEPGGEPAEVGRLDLAKEMSFHEFRGGAHPIDGVDVLIVGSAGDGFVQRLAQRGITVVMTDKTDPLEAVRDYLAHPDRLPAAGCGHQHEHHHHHQPHQRGGHGGEGLAGTGSGEGGKIRRTRDA